jgi:CDP-diacylglycerol--glycerol-3-phosphate 3-phosphatidyltransferase
LAVPGQTQTREELRRAQMASVPNLLTGLRLVLVPVFLFFLFAGDGRDSVSRVVAFLVFAVAVVTDQIDGSLARKYGVVSEFGKLADPIADKMLMGAALIGLSQLGNLPWWVTIVILVREIGVTVLRFAVIRSGVIPASRGGKLKTFVQAIAIGLFVLPLYNWPPVWHTIAWAVLWVAIVLTIATGVDYVVSALRAKKASALRANKANA